MFSIQVETTFSAAHALLIGGVRESLHGHNWRTIVRIDGNALDADGFVCDFHVVEAALQQVVARFRNVNLHDVRPFDVINPTAELVAKHIFDSMEEALKGKLPSSAWMAQVRLTEAENCIAIVTAERSRGLGV
jgi:6-pyruvoyltetrahydropterin/6-carboxytetrahydropterin synthase